MCSGLRLVPQLVARGHEVTATTTAPGKLGRLERFGATAVVMDGLDATSVGEAVAAARPDVVVHQMTAISPAHSGKPDLKHLDADSRRPIGCPPRARIIRASAPGTAFAKAAG